MPYIPERYRADVISDGAINPGELNYLITVAIETYRREHGTSYRIINDILGALEGAKLEFYRRVAVPYEDQKIKENGDVYGQPTA
jgi:hypothetical protein